jgi:hypothetical protein
VIVGKLASRNTHHIRSKMTIAFVDTRDFLQVLFNDAVISKVYTVNDRIIMGQLV